MKIRFSKMHGLGNDFMVIDGINQSLSLTPDTIQQWADRHRGIGFDQLLLVEKATIADCDFRYRIFNADGSEVEQCGNGARCLARFLLDKDLTDQHTIKVQTAKGLISLKILDDGVVSVDMGTPIFSPKEIPFDGDQQALLYTLSCANQKIKASILSMGNPHCIVMVKNVDDIDVQSLGLAIMQCGQFPEGVNVGFMQIIDRERIALRVHERGVGETQACGSGACAAVVAGRMLDKLDENVEVILRGGKLRVQWLGDNHSVQLIGPAIQIYDGEI